MPGLIKLLIIVAIIVLIFLILKITGSPRSFKDSKLSRFKKICLITSGVVLIGLVMVNSIYEISRKDNESSIAKISAPAISVDENEGCEKVLAQVLFIKSASNSVVHFRESILDKNQDTIGAQFNYGGLEFDYSIRLRNKLSIDKKINDFSTRSTITFRSKTGGGSSSGGDYLAYPKGVARVFRTRTLSFDNFLSFPSTNLEEVHAYLIINALRVDDELKEIGKDNLIELIDQEKDRLAKIEPTLTTSSSKKILPSVVLISTLGISSIILLIGSILVSLGINRNFSFPAVLLVVILCAIGVKKYEYSKYESIALDQDKSLHERKMAVINAKEMPLFKVSAKELEKKVGDL